MYRPSEIPGFILLGFVLTSCFLPSQGFAQETLPEVNWQSAADYLDDRQQVWFEWDKAKRETTSCVACHTGVPYAMVRPKLSEKLGAASTTESERRLLENVSNRVVNWDDISLYYDSKPEQSRGTEAVINALILSYMADRESPELETIRLSIKHLWSEQISTGDDAGLWHWLHFGSDTDYEPWESKAANVYGASLAAIAVSRIVDDLNDEEVRPMVDLLRQGLARKSSSTSLHNQLYIWWADLSLGGILSDEQKSEIVEKLHEVQNDDGGWAISKLGSYQRTDGTELVDSSDGYATGLVVYVQTANANGAELSPQFAQGKQWLLNNQLQDGTWNGSSVHRHRPQDTHRGRFTRDAATAMSLFALLGNSN